MAENPFVDGITNLAIPDAPHGVYLSKHVIAGSLFAKYTKVSEDADLSGMEVSRDVDLSDMEVSGNADLSDMKVSGDVDLSRMEVSGDVDLSRMEVSRDVDLSDMKISGDADLNSMEISGNATLKGMKILGYAYFCGMKISRDAYLGGMELSGDADLSGMRLSKLLLTYDRSTQVGGCLDLSDLVVETLVIIGNGTKSPLIVGSYKTNAGTNIPQTLRQILSQYKKVE